VNLAYIKTLSLFSEENTGANYQDQSIKAVREISAAASNTRTSTNTLTATDVQSWQLYTAFIFVISWYVFRL
jgi:hypothetical protein